MLAEIEGNLSSFDMIVRSVIFLLLLALGGYLFVQLYRQRPFAKDEKNNKTHDIIVKSVRIVGHKKSLMLIECNGKRILIGLSDNSISKLTEWSDDNVS